MMAHNPFPMLYHAHHSLHLEDLPFWLALADRQGSPVLELGCGTGRVLLPFAEAGHHAIGLDNDAGMLSFLHSRLTADLQARVRLVRGDLGDIPLAERFPLVVLPCNTFSTLSPTRRLRCLSGVYRLLAKGGLFAASLPNPELLRRLPRRSAPEFDEAFPHPLDGEPVQVSSAWQRTADSFQLTWYYDHLLPDGRVERLSVRVGHCLASFDELLAELQAVGLQEVEAWGDFQGTPYTPEAESLVLLARRV